jgi:LPXTG-motif cell wall-anchored protein
LFRRREVKRLMLLAAVLAMTLMATVPAIAQVNQASDQESESGKVGQEFSVTGSGSSANQCAALLGGAQSGNSQGQINVAQSDRSGADDFEFEDSGSDVTLTPEQAEECEQIINQAAAASAAPKSVPAPASKSEAKAATTKTEEKKAEEKKAEEKKAEEKKAEEKKAEEKKAEEKKELPKTGGSGVSSPFVLGTGVLLVAGGLLARRAFR